MCFMKLTLGGEAAGSVRHKTNQVPEKNKKTVCEREGITAQRKGCFVNEQTGGPWKECERVSPEWL